MPLPPPFLLVCTVALAVLIAGPVAGWPPVVRLSAVLLPVLLVAAWYLRPLLDPSAYARPTRGPGPQSRAPSLDPGSWEPSAHVLGISAGIAAAILFWIVLTRFLSGEINAVDFTVYFDRPLFQTSLGRPLYVETTDDPRFSHLTHLAVHAYWILLPLAALYKIYATPIWLLGLSVIAVVAGAIHVVRIARHVGWGGALGCATGLAYVLNDNTARALNYGFHPEVLYAWFVPWLLDAGLRRSRGSFLAAALATVLVKEDALLPLAAASVALALLRGRSFTRGERLFFLVLPPALAVANLVFYYRWVVPALAPDGAVMYGYFWANYGPTPLAALAAMAGQPIRVLGDTLTSGLLPIVMPPHLFLQVIGWKWSIGTLPIALVLGASAGEQVRGFGIYYAMLLMPFHVLGASAGAAVLARWLRREASARVAAALIIVLGATLVGRGYSLRPWRSEIAAVPTALAMLADEPIVLVQSGLYPHAGYDPTTMLLTHETLTDPSHTGAALLLAPRISAYPFSRAELKPLLRQPAIASPGAGLRVVRVPPWPLETPDPRDRRENALPARRPTACAEGSGSGCGDGG